MALNTFKIPASAEKITQNNATTKNASAARARAQNNFADLMAKEQASAQASQGAQKQPVVAKLPDSGGLPIRAAFAGRTPNDMLRMQNFNKASTDIAKTRAMESFLSTATGATGNGTLDIARGMSAAGNLRIVASGGNGKGFALNNSDYIRTQNIARIGKTGARSKTGQATGNIGKLSAKFESGKDGSAAIGYDSTGGTSYGKYQIASKVGSMKNFLSFLDREAPDLSSRLRKAGPANTGGRKGGMPDEWRKIAKEQPERLEQLEESFIHESHYKPALQAIEQRTNIDTSSLSAAMREVIWSTAVQHGPAGAAKIFAKAESMSGKTADSSYERKLISNIYTVRAGQFGSSTSNVRAAVRNRFNEERQLALKMLNENASERVADRSTRA